MLAECPEGEDPMSALGSIVKRARARLLREPRKSLPIPIRKKTSDKGGVEMSPDVASQAGGSLQLNPLGEQLEILTRVFQNHFGRKPNSKRILHYIKECEATGGSHGKAIVFQRDLLSVEDVAAMMLQLSAAAPVCCENVADCLFQTAAYNILVSPQRLPMIKPDHFRVMSFGLAERSDYETVQVATMVNLIKQGRKLPLTGADLVTVALANPQILKGERLLVCGASHFDIPTYQYVAEVAKVAPTRLNHSLTVTEQLVCRYLRQEAYFAALGNYEGSLRFIAFRGDEYLGDQDRVVLPVECVV